VARIVKDIIKKSNMDELTMKELRKQVGSIVGRSVDHLKDYIKEVVEKNANA
jgi:hypothetical protein